MASFTDQTEVAQAGIGEEEGIRSVEEANNHIAELDQLCAKSGLRDSRLADFQK